MSKPVIELYFMPYDAMLVLQCPSGIVYRNQVGGVSCAQAEIEGVLAPLDFSDADVERIMELPFSPHRGVSREIADSLDAILMGNARTRFVHVDRARLHESFEAWVFVEADTRDDEIDLPTRSDYFGSLFGFGRVKGVLTWPNSD